MATQELTQSLTADIVNALAKHACELNDEGRTIFTNTISNVLKARLSGEDTSTLVTQEEKSGSGKRKKKTKRVTKPTTSGWLLFMQEMMPSVKEDKSIASNDRMSHIARLWREKWAKELDLQPEDLEDKPENRENREKMNQAIAKSVYGRRVEAFKNVVTRMCEDGDWDKETVSTEATKAAKAVSS